MSCKRLELPRTEALGVAFLITSRGVRSPKRRRLRASHFRPGPLGPLIVKSLNCFALWLGRWCSQQGPRMVVGQLIADDISYPVDYYCSNHRHTSSHRTFHAGASYHRFSFERPPRDNWCVLHDLRNRDRVPA